MSIFLHRQVSNRMSRIFPWQYSKSMRRPRILYFSFSLFIPLFVLPPHTREPRMVGQKISSFVRITPAYAGTTRIQLQALRQSQDHPRIRGNHPILTLLLIEQQGSPPHTREPHDNTAITTNFERITPAYAGTTKNSIQQAPVVEDHPRIRGNHFVVVASVLAELGSPPHTREPQRKAYRRIHKRRITPAYAGTTR